MVSPHSLGRRAAPAPIARKLETHATEPGMTPIAAWDDADPELDAWKKTRKLAWPWRQLSLMASLCFGIGSLVLPDSVNHAVDWLLYALAGASLYAGLRKRKN